MPKQQEQKKQIAPFYIRANFDPSTIDDKNRTVEVVFVTETPVRRMGWDGWFMEILSTDKDHVRMERLNAGAPLLDNHDRYSGVRSGAQLGVIEKAWLTGKEGRATLRYSKRAGVEDVWNDVKDGILKGISVGYRVYEYLITEKEGSLPEYRAVDWEGFEISHAPVPADYKSSVRSDGQEEQLNDVLIRSASGLDDKPQIQTRKMDENENKPGADNKPAAGANAAADTTRAAENVNAENIRKEAVTAERKRSADILSATRAAKLEDSFAEKLISDGTSIDAARALIIEEFAKKDTAKGATGAQAAVRAGADETDKRRSGMMEALDFRANFSKEGAEKVRTSEYRGMDLLRLAAECIEVAGGKTRGLSNSEVAKLALNLSDRSAGMHSTSDFPIILGNTVNRRLLAEYALAPRTFTGWTRRETATDFKDMTRARLGEFDSLDEVKEGSEYKAGTLGEGKETYKVLKYGKKIAITWETLVNDDLSAFNRLPKKIADTASRKQSDIIYGILSANAALSDAVALFHATHGNLGTAGAIAIASLAEARMLMRKQKGLNAKDFLNLTPSFLVVGPNYESLALQYTSSEYLPNTQSQVNPYKNLSVVVEPRITGNEWYIMANPNSVDTIEYAFLEGEGELYTESRQGFDVDGVEIKARMVFGAKAIDYRGMVKNAGA